MTEPDEYLRFRDVPFSPSSQNNCVHQGGPLWAP